MILKSLKCLDYTNNNDLSKILRSCNFFQKKIQVMRDETLLTNFLKQKKNIRSKERLTLLTGNL